MIITRLLPATEKIRDLPGGFSVMSYKLSMARNESESCMLSLIHPTVRNPKISLR